MKKILSFLLCAVMLAVVLGGCGSQGAKAPAGKEQSGGQKKIKVVTTIFPLYDWTREVLGAAGKDAELTMLLGNGVDLHSYQPTAEDMVKISSCDVLIYVGGESEQWIEDARKEAVNKNMVAVRLMDVLGDRAKHEETVEGMEAHHHHHGDDHEKHDRDRDHKDHDHDGHDQERDHKDHDHDGHDHERDHKDHDLDGHDHEHGEEAEHHHDEFDEHIWLSLKNAEICVNAIAEALEKADGANGKVYRDNAAAYRGQLKELDKAYEAAVSGAKQKTVLFGDRFPFRYLTDDYGLKYYAAFSGCSAETEASFETIAFLSSKLDELKLPVILTIEGGSHKVAETILYNTTNRSQKILIMDSMQATTAKDVESGVKYLSVMKKNLGVLQEALR